MPRISPIRREIKYINKIPYFIKAVYRIDAVKDANGIKKYFGWSHAFKNVKEGIYYFCDLIEDAELIDDALPV